MTDQEDKIDRFLRRSAWIATIVGAIVVLATTLDAHQWLPALREHLASRPGLKKLVRDLWVSFVATYLLFSVSSIVVVSTIKYIFTGKKNVVGMWLFMGITFFLIYVVIS